MSADEPTAGLCRLRHHLPGPLAALVGGIARAAVYICDDHHAVVAGGKADPFTAFLVLRAGLAAAVLVAGGDAALAGLAAIYR